MVNLCMYYVFQVTASEEKQFSDAFTVYAVEPRYCEIFNFVAGNVPLIINLMDCVSILSCCIVPIVLMIIYSIHCTGLLQFSFLFCV